MVGARTVEASTRRCPVSAVVVLIALFLLLMTVADLLPALAQPRHRLR